MSKDAIVQVAVVVAVTLLLALGLRVIGSGFGGDEPCAEPRASERAYVDVVDSARWLGGSQLEPCEQENS